MSYMPKSDPQVVLFDNVRDPYQMSNFVQEDLEMVSRLKRNELIPWLERTGDPWIVNLTR